MTKKKKRQIDGRTNRQINCQSAKQLTGSEENERNNNSLFYEYEFLGYKSGMRIRTDPLLFSLPDPDPSCND